ncbi:MAG: arginase [Erysipelotrichaceae bacterium]|jgi:arginine decarboxylase|nr:arginase [Bacilli bacterium]NLV28637.1 arginase [Erysipelotrichaceae bacterium]
MSKRYVQPILIPLHYGANVEGIQYGADYVLEKLEDYILLPEIIIKDKQNDPNLRNFCTVIATNSVLATATSYIYRTGQFPLVIGGDHSVALGSISAVASQEENLGVIWVDAHGDMNTDVTSESGNIHGMILASLVGEGDPEMVNLHREKIKLKKENVIIFGVRDLDVGEQEIIEKLNIKYFSYSYIKLVGLYQTLEEIRDYFADKIKKLHVSIDLDSLDPIVIPGVSIPVEKGFKKDDVRIIVDYLFSNFTISSADIVEYNPRYDDNDKTLNFLIELIEKIKSLV